MLLYLSTGTLVDLLDLLVGRLQTEDKNKPQMAKHVPSLHKMKYV